MKHTAGADRDRMPINAWLSHDVVSNPALFMLQACANTGGQAHVRTSGDNPLWYLRPKFARLFKWVRRPRFTVRILLSPPRTKSLMHFTVLFLSAYEFLRTFRDFAACATQHCLQRDEFFADRGRLRRRVSIAPLRWYGSLLRGQRFSDERAEHANLRAPEREDIAHTI